MRRLPTILVCLVLASSLLGSAHAQAKEETNAETALFEKAVAALQSGAFQEAIDNLELLSDRGFSNPAASFDRALAYLDRANSPQARNGDLGQAAAGFEEALAQNPNEPDASTALEHLRKEIARRQARAGDAPLDARPSLSRAVVGALGENTWFMLAAVGSLLLAFGMALRLWARAAPAQIASLLMIACGGVLLPLGGGLAYAARTHRLHTSPAVVISASARLLDAAGMPVAPGALGSAEVGEGARVDVLETKGPLARISWGASDGWVRAAELRRLAQR